jgi:hypothetical protein
MKCAYILSDPVSTRSENCLKKQQNLLKAILAKDLESIDVQHSDRQRTRVVVFDHDRGVDALHEPVEKTRVDGLGEGVANDDGLMRSQDIFLTGHNTKGIRAKECKCKRHVKKHVKMGAAVKKTSC